MQKQTGKQSSQDLKCCPTCGCDRGALWLEAPDRYHGRTRPYQLMRCPQCELVWQDNPPDPSEMGEHYGSDYDALIGSSGERSPERWQARRAAIAKHKSGGAILDLGCSSGAFLRSLKGPAWQLYGIEMSASAAAKAEANTGAQVFVGDILDAPFAPGSFDVITCFDVLEHVYEPRKVLEKVQQWLKPDGIFYVLVPNIDSGEARVFKSYWYGLEMPRHISHFSPKSLKNLAGTVGLEGMTVETHANSAFHYSSRYIVDKLLEGVGISRSPLSTAHNPSFPAKVVNKALGTTVYPILHGFVTLAGEGESIHAVFVKDAKHRDSAQDSASPVSAVISGITSEEDAGVVRSR